MGFPGHTTMHGVTTTHHCILADIAIVSHLRTDFVTLVLKWNKHFRLSEVHLIKSTCTVHSQQAVKQQM